MSPLAHCCLQSSVTAAFHISFGTASFGLARPQPAHPGCPATRSVWCALHRGGINLGVSPKGRGDLATPGTRSIGPGVLLWLSSISNFISL